MIFLQQITRVSLANNEGFKLYTCTKFQWLPFIQNYTFFVCKLLLHGNWGKVRAGERKRKQEIIPIAAQARMRFAWIYKDQFHLVFSKNLGLVA